MDIFGLLPGVGEYFDAMNAGLYGVEGDYGNAALSGLSTIPIAGWIPAAGKLGNKAFKFGFKGSVKAGEAEADNGVRELACVVGKVDKECSFSGDTSVVMADGTVKPILRSRSEIK
ncbi:hypothetical protein ACQPXM_25590 [Kribbella sp. CA-253562]|uniref:hypothetical protein n=1 Tax=Kribbella sp. CA-253562 TaxID=3239942 RepID=UPI003D9097A4